MYTYLDFSFAPQDEIYLLNSRLLPSHSVTHIIFITRILYTVEIRAHEYAVSSQSISDDIIM